MSAVDFRRLAEVGDPDGPPAYWAIRVQNPTEARPIVLDVNLAGTGIVLPLDYSEAGELFDTLAQAMGLVVAGLESPAAGAAVASLLGLQAARQLPQLASVADVPAEDTPTAEAPVSDPSDSIPTRG